MRRPSRMSVESVDGRRRTEVKRCLEGVDCLLRQSTSSATGHFRLSFIEFKAFICGHFDAISTILLTCSDHIYGRLPYVPYLPAVYYSLRMPCLAVSPCSAVLRYPARGIREEPFALTSNIWLWEANCLRIPKRTMIRVISPRDIIVNQRSPARCRGHIG